MDLGRLIQSVGRRYVRYINRTYSRTGTLWEGRFKSAVVGRDEYLIACSRYIEMNPVRAGMVGHPRNYPWSSYRAHVGGKSGGLVDWDPWHENLGTEPIKRRKAYECWIEESIPESEWKSIREAARRSGLLGGQQFQDQIEAMLGRVVENRPPGRPRNLDK